MPTQLDLGENLSFFRYENCAVRLVSYVLKIGLSPLGDSTL